MPRRMEKAVFQQFDSRCAFCDESDVSALQIHHIEPYAKEKVHEIENLILVCANCHGRIEAGEIPVAAVYKRKIQASGGNVTAKRSSGNTIILEHSSNSGVIANQVTIKNAGRGNIQFAAPSGTIASHRGARNYVKYLIDIYHKFKEFDVGRENMKHAVFYNAIKREFGAKWDHIPLEKRDELVKFIQVRIDKTILGRNNKAKGIARYRTFDEYLEKFGA